MESSASCDEQNADGVQPVTVVGIFSRKGSPQPSGPVFVCVLLLVCPVFFKQTGGALWWCLGSVHSYTIITMCTLFPSLLEIVYRV